MRLQWITGVGLLAIAVAALVVAAGLEPMTEPVDAPWGERYFHVLDPAGHEVSIARRIDRPV